FPLEPGKTEVTVDKVWKGEAEEEVTIHLLEDGEKVDEVTLSEGNDWTHTFTDLPVVHDIKDEKAIEYTIEEVEIDGYKSNITGNAKDGFTVTNTQTTEVTGTKTWVNDHNESEELPASITVNLVVNDDVVDSQKVTAEDGWTYTFADLDKYDENGEAIDYSVTEDAVDGYEVSYDGNNITNTKVCEKFTVEVEDHEGNPVTEEEYTFESEDGDKITKTTDEDGKVTFDRDELPEGKYTVTDKDVNENDEIELSYDVDCEENIHTVILEEPKVCEEFTVEVEDHEGNPVT